MDRKVDQMEAVAFEWLGQAGFIFRGPSGAVAIDPYLSDLCLRDHGLERLTAPPCTAAELMADIVLVSHWHPDHLDLDSALDYTTSGSVIVAPPSCILRLSGRGLPKDRLVAIDAGQTLDMEGISITAVPALHEVPGAITEDAVGFVLELDGMRIYHSGDSDYDRRMLAALDRGPLDLALLCINGTGGNMNVWEAALLAAQLRPRIAVPMHWGMWERKGYGDAATLDPAEFGEIYRRLAPHGEVVVPDTTSTVTL